MEAQAKSDAARKTARWRTMKKLTMAMPSKHGDAENDAAEEGVFAGLRLEGIALPERQAVQACRA